MQMISGVLWLWMCGRGYIIFKYCKEISGSYAILDDINNGDDFIVTFLFFVLSVNPGRLANEPLTVMKRRESAVYFSMRGGRARGG